MPVTKNVRDGALFIMGDVGACGVSALYDTAKVYQGGSWYLFNWAGGPSTWTLKRRVSGTILDFNSVAGSTVWSGTLATPTKPHVLRVADDEWYLFFTQSGDIYVSKSVDVGANWTTPVLAVAHGAAWCLTTLGKPSAFVSGSYYYLYTIGNSDKIGAFRCLTSADPLDDGNWAACAANPLYDSPYSSISGVAAIAPSGKVVWWGVMGENVGVDLTRFWTLQCLGPGLALSGPRAVGTWDYGVAEAAITPVELIQNPQDGYWYMDAYGYDTAAFAWVSESLGGTMIRVPSVSPAYWTAGGGRGLIFPNGGLKWDTRQDVKVVRDRGAISHLRKGDGAGMSGSCAFAYDGDLDGLLDLIGVDHARSVGDVAVPALLLCERDYADAWGEYHLIPEAIVNVGFAEGDDADQASLDFTSPLPRPLIGRLNAASVGSDLSAPGGETPES